MIDHNHDAVARRGREPGLQLRRGSGAVSLADWAGELLDTMRPVAEILDDDRRRYSGALAECAQRVTDPGRCPSAVVLADMRRQGLSLAEFGLALARQQKAELARLSVADNAHYKLLEVEAQASLDRQCWIEEHDTLSFDEYVAAYFA
jgi:glutamate--cysteine ligase